MTPLSKFQANLNYPEVRDPAIVVTFPVVGDADGGALLARATTPWTLPSNLACVEHPDFDCVRVRDANTNNVYVHAACRLSETRLDALLAVSLPV